MFLLLIITAIILLIIARKVVPWLISKSGWSKLAKYYTAPSNFVFDGELHRFQGGYFNTRERYSEVLNIGINDKGIYLSVGFFYKV